MLTIVSSLDSLTAKDNSGKKEGNHAICIYAARQGIMECNNYNSIIKRCREGLATHVLLLLHAIIPCLTAALVSLIFGTGTVMKMFFFLFHCFLWYTNYHTNAYSCVSANSWSCEIMHG